MTMSAQGVQSAWFGKPLQGTVQVEDLILPNGQAEFYEMNQEVIVQPGTWADEEPILAQPEDYQPKNLRELVRSTPAELITRVVRDLSPGIVMKSHNGRVIEPLPLEVQWYMLAKLESDVLYTFIKDVVHRELERFAERIDEHFILVPKR